VINMGKKTNKERLATIEEKIVNVDKTLVRIEKTFDKYNDEQDKMQKIIIQNDQLLKLHLNDHTNVQNWSKQKTLAYMSLVAGVITAAIDYVRDVAAKVFLGA